VITTSIFHHPIISIALEQHKRIALPCNYLIRIDVTTFGPRESKAYRCSFPCRSALRDILDRKQLINMKTSLAVTYF